MVIHHWDHFIIVSHLTCWSLLFPHHLKLHSEVAPTARSPANQNTLTKQPCSPKHTYSTATIRLLHGKYLTCSLNNALLFSHCRLPALNSLRTPLPPHRKKAPESFQGTYQGGGSFMFLLNQTRRQTAHFRPHHSCPELQSRAPGSREVKCGENRSSCGKHVSTGQR